MSRRDPEEIAQEIANRVFEQLGEDGAQSAHLISQEIALALAGLPGGGIRNSPASEPTGQPERIVITANGHNRSGIVAKLACAIDEFNGDIREISQTIVGDYFTMIFVVDISGATSQGARFKQLRQRLVQVGEELGIHVVAMHDDILSAMHGV